MGEYARYGRLFFILSRLY